MLEKTNRMNALFDFYQPLLTKKQREYMALYYQDDLSLAEIAEQFRVSRQAVYDNIKRTETILEDYEKKLHLFERFARRQASIGRLREHLDRSLKGEEKQIAFRLLKEIEDLD